MNPRRILGPVDFSEATASGLAAATSLATQFGAGLHLLHVLNFPYPDLAGGFDVERYYHEMEEQALANMEGLVGEAAKRFAEVERSVCRGVPYLEIVQRAEEGEVDLIVLPTSGRHGLDRWFFGSTAEKVVRLAPCPVLTVSPRRDASAFHPSRVLYATDFSTDSDAALPAALEIAQQYDASVDMVHVVTMWDHDPGNPSWRFPEIPAEFRDSVIDLASEKLAERAERCVADGLLVTKHLLRGFDPAAEIVRHAEATDTDLVVMATHGHTGLSHALLGSVAEKVVRSFEGAVLTMRNRPEAD